MASAALATVVMSGALAFNVAASVPPNVLDSWPTVFSSWLNAGLASPIASNTFWKPSDTPDENPLMPSFEFFRRRLALRVNELIVLPASVNMPAVVSRSS